MGLKVGFCKETMTAVLNLMELEMLDEDVVGSQEYLKRLIGKLSNMAETKMAGFALVTSIYIV